MVIFDVFAYSQRFMNAINLEHPRLSDNLYYVK